MIPNMFKIAGELTSTVFHVTARTVATHALSIFGDHGDVMACRSTGWAMLSSASVQESQDMALIAHSATLEARVPFLHFYDGFRISHEVNKIEQITEDDVRAMIDVELVAAHRQRALSPERPKLRGTAQNPDVFFQAREACNPYYAKCAAIVQKHMDKFAKLVGRQYHLFDYVGAADADRVIVMMGSGVGVVEETVDKLVAEGQKVGMVKVRLYRPWDSARFGRRVAEDGQADRRARSHQGARRRRRAAVSGRDHGAGRMLARRDPATDRCRRSSAAATGCRRRSSRPPWSPPSTTN